MCATRDYYYLIDVRLPGFSASVSFEEGRREEQWGVTSSVNRHTAVVLQKREPLASAIHPCCLPDLLSAAHRRSGWHLISTLTGWMNSKWHAAQLFVSTFVIPDNHEPPSHVYKSVENHWARFGVTFRNTMLAHHFFLYETWKWWMYVVFWCSARFVLMAGLAWTDCRSCFRLQKYSGKNKNKPFHTWPLASPTPPSMHCGKTYCIITGKVNFVSTCCTAVSPMTLKYSAGSLNEWLVLTQLRFKMQRHLVAV